MDSGRFDTITRALSTSPSRRGIIRMFVGLTLGGILHPLFSLARAEAKKHRKKKEKLKRNIFGCVNVGGKCQGKSANCCSGICEGKKPRKGKKDKSRCAARNELDCLAGEDSCSGVVVACGTSGRCFQTTGQASFCAALGGTCLACQKDVDCESVAGPGAACIVCPGCMGTDTVCLPAAG